MTVSLAQLSGHVGVKAENMSAHSRLQVRMKRQGKINRTRSYVKLQVLPGTEYGNMRDLVSCRKHCLLDDIGDFFLRHDREPE